MRFAFKQLPGAIADYRRPVVPVTVEGLERAPQLCLLDTGALHNRFALWVADAAGIDLAEGETAKFGVGGVVSDARLAHIQLTVAGHTWDAPVWFCDPWPMSFHLLGQEGFFRWFDVRLRASRYALDISPEPSVEQQRLE